MTLTFVDRGDKLRSETLFLYFRCTVFSIQTRVTTALIYTCRRIFQTSAPKPKNQFPQLISSLEANSVAPTEVTYWDQAKPMPHSDASTGRYHPLLISLLWKISRSLFYSDKKTLRWVFCIFFPSAMCLVTVGTHQGLWLALYIHPVLHISWSESPPVEKNNQPNHLPNI